MLYNRWSNTLYMDLHLVWSHFNNCYSNSIPQRKFYFSILEDMLLVWVSENQGWSWRIAVLVWWCHMTKEEGCPWRERGESKDSEAFQVGRMIRRKRISDYRGSFQFGINYCLRIKWWATALSAALMRKWPEQCKL